MAKWKGNRISVQYLSVSLIKPENVSTTCKSTQFVLTWLPFFIPLTGDQNVRMTHLLVKIKLLYYQSRIFNAMKDICSYIKVTTFCVLGYERVYLPLYNMADTPFHNHGEDFSPYVYILYV